VIVQHRVPASVNADLFHVVHEVFFGVVIPEGVAHHEYAPDVQGCSMFGQLDCVFNPHTVHVDQNLEFVLHHTFARHPLFQYLFAFGKGQRVVFATRATNQYSVHFVLYQKVSVGFDGSLVHFGPIRIKWGQRSSTQTIHFLVVSNSH